MTSAMPSMLTVFFDHRFVRGGDGSVASRQNYHAGHLEARYGAVFDRVELVARLDEEVLDHAKTAESDSIRVRPTPGWSSPGRLARTVGSVFVACLRIKRARSCVILICPGVLGAVAALALWCLRHPYGVEVVGDPQESLLNARKGRYRSRIASRAMTAVLSLQVRGAAQSAFVTEWVLQSKYPPRPDSFTTSYSSIQLDSSFLAVDPRRHTSLDQPVIGAIAMMDASYKGVDDLIRAIALTHERGLAVQLRVAGDGRLRPSYERLARQLGIDSRACDFIGFVTPGEDLRNFYDGLDLLVSASLTEGLPRTVIEAGARGLPIVATDVGGTSELLESGDLISTKSPEEICEGVMELLGDPVRYNRAARRNLEMAQRFAASTLDARKHDFYRRLARRTRPDLPLLSATA